MNCWCGCDRFRDFSADYRECRQCGTLVATSRLEESEVEVTDEATSFYGKEYWLSRMSGDDGRGFPDIVTRARGEPVERDVYWLDHLLRFRGPPGALLEIGCSHGGFLALARQAGFQVTGTELSPWVCEFARRTFDVNVLCGRIEKLALPEGSFDVIAMMDVLEHLTDPVGTLKECVRLLAPGGVIVIQTPRHVHGRSLAMLQGRKHPFLGMLLPKEHLYLFTAESAARLFAQEGLPSLHFMPAIFSGYDMFFVAGREPLRASDQDTADAPLMASPGRRIALAVMDLARQRNGADAALRDSEEDRVAQADAMAFISKVVWQVHRNWPMRLLKAIARHVRRAPSPAAEAQLSARPAVHAMTPMPDWEQVAGQQLKQLAAVRGRIRELESAVASRDIDIERLVAWLREPERERARARESAKGQETARTQIHRKSAPRKVVVDLTPLLPGAHNGGAKVMTLDLIRRMAAQAPDLDFELLTLERTYAELGALERENVHRRLIEPAIPSENNALRYVKAILRRLPERVEVKAAAALLKIGSLLRRASEAGRGSRTDLLFCPFTAPYYAAPGIPTVCVVYDLQYAEYPQFFDPQDRAQRDHTFTEACRHASRLVCISDYVRRTVLERSNLAAERVSTVHIQLADRLPVPSEGDANETRRGLGLEPGGYLLYPANFWEHKNHRMLLTAMGMFVARNPDSKLKLVCTGAPGPRQEYFRAASVQMGLGDRVLLPGYLSDAAFAALLRGSRALIFPSLYEGFGMPVVEAMHAGVPVLCSDVTSLPEIAADAALLFDPKLPLRIVEAMERADSDAALMRELVARGHRNAARFADRERMAAQYLEILRSAMGIAQVGVPRAA